MNTAKRPRGKRVLVDVLSLGLVVLGLGGSVWAAINIAAQPDIAQSETPAAYIEANPSLVKPTSNDAHNLPAADNQTLPSPTPAPAETSFSAYPVQGDSIGMLTIPALNQNLPIIEGTGSVELSKGVGHFTQSVLPGEADNCVLSGHRDTVFSKIGRLEIGDQLIVQTSAGTYTYEISLFRIVDKDDKTVIVPTDHAVLTLTTCYPFIYIGSAPNRYIITADLVTSE